MAERAVIGFVTYAQNFEDLMLWRALNAVKEGFYIDVGAADPEEDSVTRAFYDRGWHGINIEPSPGHFAAIEAARQRDINLRCLVGRNPGEQDLYNIPDTGLSTVEKELAERHASDEYPSEAIRLPVRTLADICGEFAPRDIHFLKIDVEGAEEAVLRGADFVAYRPWIVLVEATVPMSQEENWEGWDPLLTKAGYIFAWFDGLNRFYLASERAGELRHAFRTPPNVFDGWVRPRGQQQIAILRRSNAIQEAMERLREDAAKTSANLDAEAIVARTEAHVSRTEASTARAEASALRVAEHAARQEADAAQANAAALQAALAMAQQDASTVRAELARCTAEIRRLGEVQQAARQAEAMLAAIRASTSWEITAPMRSLSNGLRLFRLNPARRQRLRLVAGLSQGPAGSKGLARIAVYGVGRFVARAPAGRAVAGLVRAALPGPFRWLYTRYAIYRNAVGTDLLMEPGPVTEGRFSSAAPQEQNILSAEEQVMLHRLRARDDAA
jgi:FkbM family methyltransferase